MRATCIPHDYAGSYLQENFSSSLQIFKETTTVHFDIEIISLITVCAKKILQYLTLEHVVEMDITATSKG